MKWTVTIEAFAAAAWPGRAVTDDLRIRDGIRIDRKGADKHVVVATAHLDAESDFDAATRVYRRLIDARLIERQLGRSHGGSLISAICADARGNETSPSLSAIVALERDIRRARLKITTERRRPQSRPGRRRKRPRSDPDRVRRGVATVVAYLRAQFPDGDVTILNRRKDDATSGECTFAVHAGAGPRITWVQNEVLDQTAVGVTSTLERLGLADMVRTADAGHGILVMTDGIVLVPFR